MVDLASTALSELNFPAVLEKISTYCVTPMGADAVRNLSPLPNTAILNEKLLQVHEAVNIIVTSDSIPLEQFPDISALLKRARIAGNYLSAPELLNVSEALVASRTMKRFCAEKEGATIGLRTLTQFLADNRILEKHITEAIDETCVVRDTASRELRTIRADIHQLEGRLRSRLRQILRKFGEEELLQEEFVTQRDGRFVLPLQVQNKRAVNGIIHGMSSSGQTVFLEPAETYELNNDLALLRGREQREIINILTMLTAEVGSVCDELEATADILVELDTIFARAWYARYYGGIMPIIVDDDMIELTNVRHPLLMHQAMGIRTTNDTLKSSHETIIPLTVRLGGDVRGILISGPNAGGKTVAMKTIGLSLAMAMSGIFPLGTCVCPLRRLYTSIGDHQSIDANLSTFSSQIIRLRDVLSECDHEALILIDEICAGTDPAEGGALAAGILDSALARGACFVVTTHQSSPKQYALTSSRITNASLAFDEERMQPTFRFLYGVPGNSYAFDLSRTVGLPEVVLRRAQEYLGNRHNELEQSISAMQQFRNEAEQHALQAAREHQASEKLRKEYEERLSDLKAKKSKEIESARIKAAEILEGANALIENTIREIREQQKSIAEVKTAFNEKRQQLTHREKGEHSNTDSSATDTDITVGTMVRIEGTASVGTVEAIDAKGNAVVHVNGITMRVQRAKLEPTSEKAQAPVKRKAAVRSSTEAEKVAVPAMTLDLRGQRAEEALRALEVFVDSAVVRSLPFVSIIHGKGTGALREVVHRFLEQQHGIRSFRLGSIPEGGDGVTIVEL